MTYSESSTVWLHVPSRDLLGICSLSGMLYIKTRSSKLLMVVENTGQIIIILRHSFTVSISITMHVYDLVIPMWKTGASLSPFVSWVGVSVCEWICAYECVSASASVTTSNENMCVTGAGVPSGAVLGQHPWGFSHVWWGRHQVRDSGWASLYQHQLVQQHLQAEACRLRLQVPGLHVMFKVTRKRRNRHIMERAFWGSCVF